MLENRFGPIHAISDVRLRFRESVLVKQLCDSDDVFVESVFSCDCRCALAARPSLGNEVHGYPGTECSYPVCIGQLFKEPERYRTNISSLEHGSRSREFTFSESPNRVRRDLCLNQPKIDRR